jgi:hypothetical protein
MRIGDFTIWPLVDGEISSDPSMLYRNRGGADWAPYEQFLEPSSGSYVSTVGGFLIRGNGRTVVVDAGIGSRPVYPWLGGGAAARRHRAHGGRVVWRRLGLRPPCGPRRWRGHARQDPETDHRPAPALRRRSLPRAALGTAPAQSRVTGLRAASCLRRGDDRVTTASMNEFRSVAREADGAVGALSHFCLLRHRRRPDRH